MHQRKALRVPDDSNQESPEQNSGTPPPVSVLVAVYNHAPFVRECLDSIVASEYPAFELIIINDASPDDADVVICTWLSEHPEVNARYIKNGRNLGVTKTLNRAVQASSGTFLCLLAGDDLILPNGIGDRVAYLNEHPEKLAVFADCHVIDEDSCLIHESAIEDFLRREGMRKRVLEVDALMLDSIVFNWAVMGPVFACRRELFDTIGLYDEELLVEDWDMYIRIAAAGKLGFYNGCVAKYRVHSRSMVRQHKNTNFLASSMLRTCEKNMQRTKGLARFRLLATRTALMYDVTKTWYGRVGLWFAHKFLLASSNTAYRVKKFLVLAWNRASGSAL